MIPALQFVAVVMVVLPLSSQAVNPPRFDRVTATIDSATYAHIAASAFVTAQLGAVESMMIMPDGARRVGIVLHGAATSVAFAPPGGGLRGGAVTLALASERRGGLDALIDRARSRRIAFDTMTLQITSAGQDVARRRIWRVANAESVPPNALLVVGEPHPAFIVMLGIRDSLASDDLSRARLQRGSYDPSRLLADVTGVTLALSESDIVLFRRALEATGATIEGEGMWVVVRLDGFTLRLVPAYERAGIRRLDVALTRQVPGNPTYRFGSRSKLRFGPGAVASWEF